MKIHKTCLAGCEPVIWLGYSLDEIRERFPEIDQASIEQMPDCISEYDDARDLYQARGYMVM